MDTVFTMMYKHGVKQILLKLEAMLIEKPYLKHQELSQGFLMLALYIL